MGYKSPDGNHKVEFFYDGQIKFGPTYYKIKLDGKLISNRIFGQEYKWDSNSEYIAIQEWLTSDYQIGPITTLTVIDPNNNLFSKIYMANKGFVSPLKFTGNRLQFKAEYFGEEIEERVEESFINIDTIQNWEKL